MRARLRGARAGARLMPRIPIISPPEHRDGAGTGGGPEMLPPDQAAGLRTLEVRTARIDRELAVSQSWLAGLERLAEAEDAPEGSPPGFARRFLEEADRERALLLKPIPPGRQSPLEQDLIALRGGLAERAAAIEAEGMALRRRLGLHRTLEGYRSGIARDPGLYDHAAGRMLSLVADLDLPDERRHALDLHVRDALGNAAVDGLMREPARTERMLSAGLFDDVLTEVSRASRLKEAQRLVARQQLFTRERTLSDLTVQADQGAASEEAIAAAARGGILSAAEVEQLRAWNADAIQASALREDRIRRVSSAIHPLDPVDPEDKASVDAYWEEVSEVYASGDAEAQRKAELAFVARIGVLPDGLKRKYQGALLSADPAVAVSGAAAIDALVGMSPSLVADIPSSQRHRAVAIAKFASLDLPPERATELADARVGGGEAALDAAAAGPPASAYGEDAGAPVDPVISDVPTSDGNVTPASDYDGAQTDEALDATGIDGGNPTEGASDDRTDGAAVVVDPETGERTTVDRDSVERLAALAAEHEVLIGLHDTYLDLYGRVASGEITREDATRLLLGHLKQTLPSANEAGSPFSDNYRLRQTLQRLATDIFDARDRADAEKLFIDGFNTTVSIQTIGEFLLSLAPVTGELISAKDAYYGFLAAIEASRRGDDDAMLREGAWATLAAVGTLPLLGYIPRLGRAGRKTFRTTRQLLRHTDGRGKSAGPPRTHPIGTLDELDPNSFSIPNHSGKIVLDQGREQSCGVYCAAMLLGSLGKKYNIDKIKKLVDFTNETGTDVVKLADAVQKLGVKSAQLLENKTLTELARRIDKNYPAIIMVEVTTHDPKVLAFHGVLVDKIYFSPNTDWRGLVYIRDPAGGREYATPLREFEEKYIGMAIVTKPRR